VIARRVVPCLDFRGGAVVKGIRFAALRDVGDPVALARRYAEQGADELLLLDVAATLEERAASRATVAAVRAAVGLPITVGGGVRSAEDARALLEAGADRVAVNSAAVARPELIAELAREFGRQSVVVAIDATRAATPDAARGAACGGFEIVVRAGSTRAGLDAVAWAREAEASGAGELLLTSLDRDGTRAGFDVELLRAVVPSVAIPVVASGGARGPDDFVEAARAGAEALLGASLFHDGDWTVGEVKQALAAAGFGVRGRFVPASVRPGEESAT